MTKIFYLTDNFTYNQTHECKKQLLVDSGSKKIILVDYDSGKFLIIDFNEIVNYEIYENGGNVTTGAAAGGWFVGFFGAETTGKCNELRLIIRLKKYDRPQVSYKLVSDTIFNSGIAKNSAQYKQVVSDLQDVVSFLEVVKEENMKNKNDQA
ncbi:MAG: hypothetical protein J6K39_04255 [Clostridia bacterium]|nr:hypothetical protein [Clostridia bacterium]